MKLSKMSLFKNRPLLLSLVLLCILYLASPTKAYAQNISIQPEEFRTTVDEFGIDLTNLNPDVEYKLNIQCLGTQVDYKYSFVPKSLDRAYWLDEIPTSIKLYIYKSGQGMNCTFQSNNYDSQVHTVTLTWGSNGKTQKNYKVLPRENYCNVEFDNDNIDVNFDLSTAGFRIYPVDGYIFTGIHGVILRDKDNTIIYNVTGIIADDDGKIKGHLDEFGEFSNPGTYSVELIKNSNQLCTGSFNLYSYLEPTPTPDPQFTAVCNQGYDDYLSKSENSGKTAAELLSGFCSQSQYSSCHQCPQPTPGQPGINPRAICEQLGDSNDQSSCFKCFDPKNYGSDANERSKSPGSWTALGCIPTDTAGFVKWLLGPFMGIAGGIAFLLILKGGYQIMFSQGNPESITDGRDTIVAAVSGLVVIILSVAILEIIGVEILNIPGFGR